MPPATKNQNPEQIARDQIDAKLAEAGWHVQTKVKINFNAGLGIAVREYQTDIGPADYVLFVDRQAVGVIEAKPQEMGHNITTVEEQSEGYASAKLKWVANKKPLPFVYESTGVVSQRNAMDAELREIHAMSCEKGWCAIRMRRRGSRGRRRKRTRNW